MTSKCKRQATLTITFIRVKPEERQRRRKDTETTKAWRTGAASQGTNSTTWKPFPKPEFK